VSDSFEAGFLKPDRNLPGLAEAVTGQRRARAAPRRWWRRPSLAWRPAAEVWNARRPLRTNRRELREEVMRRTALLRSRLGTSRRAGRLAERLAIEQALEDRGLVRRIPGGW
jgi:hypothetical protein